MRNELMTDLQMMEERLVKLDKAVGEIKQSCLTGLTTEELQGIHGLIQNQIGLISSLQTPDNCLKIHSAVTPLAILVSLVSKPTA